MSCVKYLLDVLEEKANKNKQIKEIEIWNEQYSCSNCKRLYCNRNDIDTNFKIKNKHCSYCGQLIKWD